MGSTRTIKLPLSLTLMMLVLLSSDISRIAGGFSPSSFTNYGPGRKLLQAENASDDTVRVDPLDNLKKYRGGYDIRNKHYWSSTAFTGIYGYAIGVLWLLCGLTYGGYLAAAACCCRSNNRKLKKGSGGHNKSYPWPLLLATLFTILAIIATGLVLGGTVKFHSRAKKVVDIIIDTADDASQTIYDTTGAMRNMSSRLEATDTATEASRFLTSTSQELDSAAGRIHRQAKRNRDAIDKGLKIVYIVTILVISLTLIALLALSVFGVLRLRRPLHLFIILCWLLTVLCWLFFGAYFFLDKFAGDTCTALEDFQRDPRNNSLSSILPCDDLDSARSALFEVREGIYGLVDEVNRNISDPQGSSFVQICNPFSGPPHYQYLSGSCPENAIRIGDIPQLLRMLTCVGDAENGTCNGGVYITTSTFRTVEAYTSSIEDILNVYPGMESLVGCETVKDAFSEILLNHCKPLKKDAHMAWAAMASLSTVMVALVVAWTIKAYRAQKYHFSDGSTVKPHSKVANTPEPGTAKAAKADSFPDSVL